MKRNENQSTEDFPFSFVAAFRQLTPPGGKVRQNWFFVRACDPSVCEMTVPKYFPGYRFRDQFLYGSTREVVHLRFVKEKTSFHLLNQREEQFKWKVIVGNYTIIHGKREITNCSAGRTGDRALKIKIQ